MSELTRLLNKASEFVEKTDTGLKRLNLEADEKGNWEDYDEYKADVNEEVRLLLDDILAAHKESPVEGIDLVFGDGTDGDTFETIFEVLKNYDGYVIGVNGTSIQVKAPGVMSLRHLPEHFT